jgi:hypothetical protein
MHHIRFNQARRTLLMRSAEMAGLVALAAVTGRSTTATAKATKGDFMYQDHQHDGKNCGQCKFFSPRDPSTNIGSCLVIEGTVSREGWCAAFVLKPPA